MRTVRLDEASCARRSWPIATSAILVCFILTGCHGMIPSARFAGCCSPGPGAYAVGEPTAAIQPVEVIESFENAVPPGEKLAPDPEPEIEPAPKSRVEPTEPASNETAAAPETDSNPVTAAETPPRPLQIPSERVRQGAEMALSDVASETACEPVEEVCAVNACPSLCGLPRCHIPWRSCNLRCYLGPLFCRRGPLDEQAMAEAALQPPFARFHPVPAAPVFEPRYDYEPPQLMMVPVKDSRLQREMSPRPFTPPDATGMAPL